MSGVLVSGKKSEANPSNPRGIPSADFIVRTFLAASLPPRAFLVHVCWILVYPIRIQEDVGAFLGDEQSANEAIADWQERYQKYKLMESHLQQKREELKKKIPDIDGTLELLTQVIKKRVCSLSQKPHSPSSSTPLFVPVVDLCTDRSGWYSPGRGERGQRQLPVVRYSVRACCDQVAGECVLVARGARITAAAAARPPD